MDTNTRRKMDEMLKTWKEPVPGAMDTRPVFPPEITRPIENALIKARTSFLEAQQQLQRNQPQVGRGRPMVTAAPYRETPTPPGVVQQQISARPGYSGYQQPGYPPTHTYAPPQQYSTPPPYQAPQPYQQPPQAYQQPSQYSSPQPYQNQINGQQPQPQSYGLPQVSNLSFR
jgi:pre-mRNA cleavage complex 2 protein Pcf11